MPGIMGEANQQVERDKLFSVRECVCVSEVKPMDPFSECFKMYTIKYTENKINYYRKKLPKYGGKPV